MPNYAYNCITVAPEHLDILKSLGTEKNPVLDFELLIPMPPASATFCRGGVGNEERDKFGHNNWFDWSVKNWGTKWNACDPQLIEETCSLRFDTAWASPTPVLHALSKQHPGVRFTFRATEESHAFAFYGELLDGEFVVSEDIPTDYDAISFIQQRRRLAPFVPVDPYLEEWTLQDWRNLAEEPDLLREAFNLAFAGKEFDEVGSLDGFSGLDGFSEHERMALRHLLIEQGLLNG